MLFRGAFVIFAAILLRCTNANLDNCEPTDSRHSVRFTCDVLYPDVVFIYGTKVQCPENSYCNSLLLKIQGTNICEPCLSFKTICEEDMSKPNKIPYTCIEDNSAFEMNGQKFTCPKSNTCVAPKATKDACSPCVPKQCSKQDWTCHADIVIMQGIQGTCAPGKVCNSEYRFPCEPCVTPDNWELYPINGAPKVEVMYGIVLSFILCVMHIY